MKYGWNDFQLLNMEADLLKCHLKDTKMASQKGWYFKIYKFDFNLAGLLEGTSEHQPQRFGSCTGSLVGQPFSASCYSTLIYFKPSVKLARFRKSFTSKDYNIVMGILAYLSCTQVWWDLKSIKICILSVLFEITWK